MESIKSFRPFWAIIISILLLSLFFGLTYKIFIFIPKLIILALIIGFILIFKMEKQFFSDWFLFLSFIYLSDTMRGIIYYFLSRFKLPIYCEYVIRAEYFIFKTIPSVWLQNHFLKDGQYGTAEKILTIIHGTHYIAFLVVGFYIWLKARDRFNQYKVSFYILITAGLCTYALVPTAPPWMSSAMFGLLPDITHFNQEIYTGYIPDLTAGFSTNPVAAMPSLHAAFPILCSFLIWKLFKLKGFILYLYTCLMLFTIIYTGDHYVIDILAGALLAFISYLLSEKIHSNTMSTADNVTKVDIRPRIKAFLATAILLISIISGQIIKPVLKQYYLKLSHLNFIDFTKHREKAESNFLIALYLGDFEAEQNDKSKALYYYNRAYSLAKNSKDRFSVRLKIMKIIQNNN